MKGHGKMPRKQGLAIAGLLEAPTIKEAAQVTEVGESTIFRWLQDPGFQEAFQKAKQQTVRQAITRLQQVTGEAVDVLRKVMNDSETPAGSLVTTARIILDTALKAMEMEELESRLVKVEREVLERNKRGMSREPTDNLHPALEAMIRKITG